MEIFKNEMDFDTIQTTRLQLIPVTPKLIQELNEKKSEAEIKDFFGFDENGYLQFQSMAENGMETHNITLFFFILKELKTNKSIGDCGYHSFNIKHRRAELFYNIHNEANRRFGYMSEAVVSVIQFGFEKLNLHRIEAKVAEYNKPSVRLIEKNGFSKEGIAREDYCVDGVNEDSHVYSLLKWEWNSKKL